MKESDLSGSIIKTTFLKVTFPIFKMLATPSLDGTEDREEQDLIDEGDKILDQ